ncbi:formyltetrahydrofolate deformylase [Bermanella marisrubri]|uniref:Formyltetrahydrofolate deformylase n=1 Tax=Bermanella marisrubri TaxID=207949 RepID=Q1N0B6_9GAMM|nr:formyltetrahydrofolate deformylase [Bermanella marisrubri]EAT11601.1 formyltetrahydrofolate deformylase [Oceanobacter sp. RED65] [Bermanella marisrubri]QIZ83354.1 formyltetrahydrofolate deformylase [Bermanella marisrubri]
MEPSYRLIISCPDRVGIVAKVGQFVSSYGGWIVEANHYADPTSGWFFMRHCIKAESLPFGLDEFREKFAPIAEEFEMDWAIAASEAPKKMVLLASKESHCLVDVLHRWHSGELHCDIPCVISNHDDLRSLVEWHGIPFFHVPVDKENKQEHFDRVSAIIEEHQADVIVLARYMQILPADVCAKYEGQIINIHHSFLPSFVGAKPYHQAAERGVKLIGATCHYVTQDLDAGPIIDQDVVRISHKDTVEDMVRLGKDVEKMVLSRGVRLHLEDRVLRHGNKTIVF